MKTEKQLVKISGDEYIKIGGYWFLLAPDKSFRVIQDSALIGRLDYPYISYSVTLGRAGAEFERDCS